MTECCYFSNFVPIMNSTIRDSMITKESIETAYCFLHQKWRVYKFSHNDNQKDDIEYIIGNYVHEMAPELFKRLSHGNKDFLSLHSTFAKDMEAAVDQLETMLNEQTSK